ncbi:MAG: hypothetical protein ABIQ89_01730 [Candidatus Saccharimonadales bacterium]
MTNLLNPTDHMPASFEAKPSLDDAIVDGVIKLTENYEQYLAEQRPMFSAYFMYGNDVHDGQHALLSDELGLTPHPSKPGMVVTLEGVELFVTIGCFDTENGEKPVPYDIVYSTSSNGLLPPAEQA